MVRSDAPADGVRGGENWGDNPYAITLMNGTPTKPERKLLLIFVAYHVPMTEVRQLQSCLDRLSENIGYGVVVNDYKDGEPIDELRINADYFLENHDNLGYGRAFNRLAKSIKDIPEYIGVLNTDLSWKNNTFEKLLDWLKKNSDVSLAVPSIVDSTGLAQKLCKQNPSILALVSRRFISKRYKPEWLKKYDHWYSMNDKDYSQIFEAPYLSGCCMLMRSKDFLYVGGFDEHYFLYLEDADLTRTLSRCGRCVHLPIAAVEHEWGRGNYRSLRLLLVNIMSAWIYFRKWGIKLV